MNLFNESDFMRLDKLMNEKEVEFSESIVTSVCDAMDRNADVVEIPALKEIGIQLHLEREYFLNALEVNLKRLHKAEMYELCARAVKAIKILKGEKSLL